MQNSGGGTSIQSFKLIQNEIRKQFQETISYEHTWRFVFNCRLLIRLNNTVTGSQYMGLRTCDVKPAGVSKWYMSVNKIEPALYGLVDNFSDRKITPRQFCMVFLDEIHPFVNRNGRTCKVLFSDKIENFSYLFGDYIF